MMFGLLFLLMFMVSAGALVWRIVVTKSRSRWIRVGGACAATATLVGAFVVFDEIANFSFRNWRSDVGLLAAMSGSAYLGFWSLRRRTNRRHRTISLVAALIGFVPVLGAIATALILQE